LRHDNLDLNAFADGADAVHACLLPVVRRPFEAVTSNG
jgi:hypothetical protein